MTAPLPDPDAEHERAPLVPLDVDLRGLPGFILDVDRLLASELFALCTPEQGWAALSLWCRAWKQTPPGSMPDDERLLAAFSGAGKRWPKVRDMALRGFVKCSDGRLYHRVLCAQVMDAWGKRKGYFEKREKDAKRLADWRERNALGNAPETELKRVSKRVRNIAEVEVEVEVEVEGEVKKSKASTARKRATPTKTALPDDFKISDRVKQWAENKGFSLLDAHLESFVGKCKAKGYSYADWDEAFMGAIRDDWAGLRKGNGAPATQPAKPVDKSCIENVAGQPCGMPGELDFNGRTYICPHHKAKRVEASKAPMPEAARKKLKDAGMLRDEVTR